MVPAFILRLTERLPYRYDSLFSAVGTVIVIFVHWFLTGLADVLGFFSVHGRSFRFLELLPSFLEQTHCSREGWNPNKRWAVAYLFYRR